MRFQVPQFIEREAKIIGPLTLKQFGWVGLGGILIFFVFVATTPLITIIVGLFIAPLAIALAFAKIEGVPLPTFLIRFVSYLMNPKQYKFKR